MRRLFDDGVPASRLALQFGVSRNAVYYQCKIKDQRKAAGRMTGAPRVRPTKLAKDEIAHRGLAPWQIAPDDTRSLTGRSLGDPLPGRSALDMLEELRALTFKSPGRPVGTQTKEQDGPGGPD